MIRDLTTIERYAIAINSDDLQENYRAIARERKRVRAISIRRICSQNGILALFMEDVRIFYDFMQRAAETSSEIISERYKRGTVVPQNSPPEFSN